MTPEELKGSWLGRRNCSTRARSRSGDARRGSRKIASPASAPSAARKPSGLNNCGPGNGISAFAAISTTSARS